MSFDGGDSSTNLTPTSVVIAADEENNEDKPSTPKSKDPYFREKLLKKDDDSKISQAILRAQQTIATNIKRTASLDWSSVFQPPQQQQQKEPKTPTQLKLQQKRRSISTFNLLSEPLTEESKDDRKSKSTHNLISAESLNGDSEPRKDKINDKRKSNAD